MIIATFSIAAKAITKRFAIKTRPAGQAGRKTKIHNTGNYPVKQN
jgi:hypothetical protein